MLASLGSTEPILPEYPVELFDDDPAKIARSVRATMNIPPGPVFNLTETLERNGCIVVAHNFGSRYLDGFSQRPNIHRVSCLNDECLRMLLRTN